MRKFFLLFLLAWLLGVSLGAAGIGFWVAILAAALTAGAVFFLKQRSQIVFTSLALVWLGFVWGSVSAASVTAEPCDLSALGQARIVAPVQLREQQVRFVAEFEGGCRILVSAERFAGVREGDVIELVGGEVQTPDDVREFSEGYAKYLERQGISGTWGFATVVSGPTTPRPAGWRAGLRGVSQQSLAAGLHEAVMVRVTSVFTEPEASLVMAMLFAEYGTLPEELVNDFRATGVSHILSISGLHVSLLTGLLVGLLLFLPLGPKTRTVLALVLLWLYIIFIGAPASAVRAAAFWTLALGALRLYLLIGLPTVFLLAASALVSFKPLYLADVSFQLSVSAVAGIFLALFLVKPYFVRLKPAVRSVLSLLLVSLGAMLATGPLVAYHFQNVAMAGIVTNLIVVPLSSLFLVLAIIALVVSFVFMPAALLVSLLLRIVMGGITTVTSVFADLPGLYFTDVVVPLWFIPLYYLALAAACIAIVRWQGRSWREAWVP